MAKGIGGLSKERIYEITSSGGRKAHQNGTAHKFSSEEARAAGKIGGKKISANRAHMSAIGKLGGKASSGKFRTKSQTVGDTACMEATKEC